MRNHYTNINTNNNNDDGDKNRRNEMIKTQHCS